MCKNVSIHVCAKEGYFVLGPCACSELPETRVCASHLQPTVRNIGQLCMIVQMWLSAAAITATYNQLCSAGCECQHPCCCCKQAWQQSSAEREHIYAAENFSTCADTAVAQLTFMTSHGQRSMCDLETPGGFAFAVRIRIPLAVVWLVPRPRIKLRTY